MRVVNALGVHNTGGSTYMPCTCESCEKTNEMLYKVNEQTFQTSSQSS